jgi:uncharacterized protein
VPVKIRIILHSPVSQGTQGVEKGPPVDSQVSEIMRFFLRHSKKLASLVVLGFLALGIVGAASLHRLKTEYSMKQFLPTQHPLMVADDQVKARFQLAELEPFFAVVTLKEGDWFDPIKMTKLATATTEIREWPGVNRSISLGTVEGAGSSNEGLTVGRLVELTPSPQWKERILRDPLLTPGLVSQDGRTAILAVGLSADVGNSASRDIQEKVRELVAKKFDAEIRIGGIPAVQAQMGTMLAKELGNFLILSVLASVITLLLFFRSFSAVVIPLGLVLIANLACLGMMAILGISFTVLLSTLPVLVAITVVSMASHTMMRYAADWELAKRSQENPNPVRVLLKSYHGLLLPNFLTSVTTAIGFLAIAFGEIPLIRQYGLTVGFSIFICWFVVIGSLLPLLILFPVPKVRHWTEARARWSIWLVSHGKGVVAAMAVFCTFCLWFGKDLNWSARLFDDLPAGHEARTTTEFFDKHLGGMIPFDLVIEGEEENAWNSPEALAKIDQLAQSWRQHPAVGSVVGPHDLIRAAGEVQGRGLASTRQEAAEYAFLYGFSENDPYKKFVTADGRAARIAIRLRDVPADQMKAVVGSISSQAKAEFPGWKVVPAGMATTVHELNNELSSELIYGFWQALACIAIVLLVVFRSLRWTLVAVVPNLVPVFVLLAALHFGDTPIKPGIALIFSIALGISFDNTVYLLGRLRLLRERSKDGRIQVGKAWFQEGNLCLFSSVALSAGFLVFLTSYFSLNQQFGVYMLLAIGGSLLGDLILMPAMLAAFPSLLKDRKKPEEREAMPNKAIAAGLALTLFFPLSSYAVKESHAAKPDSKSVAKVDPRDAEKIMEMVEKNVTSKDEVATVRMMISEADGTKKERALEIRRKGADNQQKVLVRLQGPADLKGTALLSVNKGKSSDQWLFLPSSKQTRRIQSSKKNGSFMDSELSYEDMGTSSEAQFSSKVLREEDMGGRRFSVIESVPKGESSYGKIHVWVDLETYLVGKMEYFDKAQKPLKVSTFSNYKKFDQGVWRAQKIQVANLQTKRGTVLELSGLALNKGLDDGEFTESALTEGD